MGIPYKLRKLWHSALPHYEIIGGYTGEVIGCCCGKRSQRDVLYEEPNATFRRVRKSKCPICHPKIKGREEE